MDKNLLSSVILGILGLLFTLYYSQHNKKLAHEQLLKQLFTEFNRRYDELNNFLIIIERNFSTLEALNKAENSDVLRQKVIDYFSLCAEEFYWFYHKKRIDEIIWKSWQSGMNYWYNNVPAIKSLWDQEVATNGKESYYITNHVEFFKIH